VGDLRRLIPDALELVATNADHWHPDFVMKLWITFHPQLAPVLAGRYLSCSSRKLSHCRANKKPRPTAGRGCVGSDTKLLCMRVWCRTGSTPRQPNTVFLFRYEYNMIPPPRAGHGAFTTKHFLFRLPINGR
jgi:hypothetical protein